MVVMTYILVAPEGFQLNYTISVWISVAVTALLGVWFFGKNKQRNGYE
jgi:hypothetical protein